MVKVNLPAMNTLPLHLTIIIILIIFAAPAVNAAQPPGPFFAIGLGSSPIYIEEQIKNKQLSAGVTTIAFHSQLLLGYSFGGILSQLI